MCDMDNFNEYISQFKHTEYLGDGAYVGHTGFSYALFTSDGVNIHDVVYLEEPHLDTLNKFRGRVS